MLIDGQLQKWPTTCHRSAKAAFSAATTGPDP